MSVDQPFNIYRDQLSSLYHGLALWDPKPVENLHKQPSHVSIGDVGYLDNGAFMRMFNVTLPCDDPSNKLLGKPEKYERIKPSDFSNVRDNEIREGEYYTPHVCKVLDNVGANRHEDSLGQMYQCKAQNRGALLSLPHKGHRKDVIPLNVFEDYIRDNVDKWFRWSKKMKLPVKHMEDLILVTGCTLVTSWAAAAFDGHMSVDSDATTISLEARKIRGGRTQFFWRNIYGSVEYHNSRFGPDVRGPQPQNQCIFIRGFRAKRIFFRTIPMRAAAEPLPDDPDDRREDEIEVTRIPGSSRYRDPLVGVLDYIVQKCTEDISAAEDIKAIVHDDDLRLIEGVETLTADAIEKFLHEKKMPLLVENGAAILRDRPEINQTTERKEGGFLRQICSHLFRPMRAGLASVLGIRNPPTVPTPIPSSSGPCPALSVAYVRDDVQDVRDDVSAMSIQHKVHLSSIPRAKMPTYSRLTPSWRGYIRIKKFMVFGDSYSHVGYSAQAPVPTSSNPLGVAFPGQPVNEPGQPNWVGYLLRDHGHGHANMVAYDYARRGDTVNGVYTNQVAREFLPTVGRKPAWASWSPTDSIFVTWVGTNDCRILYTNEKAEITPIIANLFAAQDTLYRAGARNFLFIDVPPLHMSPIGTSMGGKGVRFGNWNDELQRGLAHFATNHPDATVMLFSAWDTFSRILSDPAQYGFSPADRTVQGGSIWFDFMHPTSRVHSILAGDIAHFLFSQPPQA